MCTVQRTLLSSMSIVFKDGRGVVAEVRWQDASTLQFSYIPCLQMFSITDQQHKTIFGQQKTPFSHAPDQRKQNVTWGWRADERHVSPTDLNEAVDTVDVVHTAVQSTTLQQQDLFGRKPPSRGKGADVRVEQRGHERGVHLPFIIGWPLLQNLRHDLVSLTPCWQGRCGVGAPVGTPGSARHSAPIRGVPHGTCIVIHRQVVIALTPATVMHVEGADVHLIAHELPCAFIHLPAEMNITLF